MNKEKHKFIMGIELEGVDDIHKHLEKLDKKLDGIINKFQKISELSDLSKLKIEDANSVNIMNVYYN